MLLSPITDDRRPMSGPCAHRSPGLSLQGAGGSACSIQAKVATAVTGWILEVRTGVIEK